MTELRPGSVIGRAWEVYRDQAGDPAADGAGRLRAPGDRHARAHRRARRHRLARVARALDLLHGHGRAARPRRAGRAARRLGRRPVRQRRSRVLAAARRGHPVRHRRRHRLRAAHRPRPVPADDLVGRRAGDGDRAARRPARLRPQPRARARPRLAGVRRDRARLPDQHRHQLRGRPDRRAARRRRPGRRGLDRQRARRADRGADVRGHLLHAARGPGRDDRRRGGPMDVPEDPLAPGPT